MSEQRCWVLTRNGPRPDTLFLSFDNGVPYWTASLPLAAHWTRPHDVPGLFVGVWEDVTNDPARPLSPVRKHPDDKEST